MKTFFPHATFIHGCGRLLWDLWLSFCITLLLSITSLQKTALHAQMMPPTGAVPWNSNLMIRSGTDGNSFGAETKFADSSGVPSLLRDAQGRILAAFQWFPAPLRSQYWDKVAVKISDDNGKTWSQPQPIVVNGLPSSYQRPFDPTLALTEDGRIRIYFSSSPGPALMLDSTVATYSAVSTDGVRYTFEPGIRFSAVGSGKPVIDPAVLRIGKKWYYTAPKGAPQDGAYHATSDDGLTWTRRGDIPSDSANQWTGNLVEYGAGMRFYGAGRLGLWWSYSADGTSWTKPTTATISGATTMTAPIRGGDPTVLKLADNNYLLMYVSAPVNQMMTAVDGASQHSHVLRVSPNPTSDILRVNFTLTKAERISLELYNVLGQHIATLLHGDYALGAHEYLLQTSIFPQGAYFLRLTTSTTFQTSSFFAR